MSIFTPFASVPSTYTSDQLPQVSPFNPLTRLLRISRRTPSLSDLFNDPRRLSSYNSIRRDNHALGHNGMWEDLDVVLDNRKGLEDGVGADEDVIRDGCRLYEAIRSCLEHQHELCRMTVYIAFFTYRSEHHYQLSWADIPILLPAFALVASTRCHWTRPRIFRC